MEGVVPCPYSSPPHPNLKQLKNQAKDLRRAHQSAAATAIERFKTHLPLFANASDAKVGSAAISLQDCQHVIAREYGFESWNWLRAVVEVDFDLLNRLGERDIQILQREVDNNEWMLAFQPLTDAAGNAQQCPDELVEKVLKPMPQPLRAHITEGMVERAPVPPDQVRETRQRILKWVDVLARHGYIAWPDGSRTTPASEPVDDVSPFLLELVRHPLEEMSIEQIAELAARITLQARRLGIWTLQPLVEKTVDPFLREALQLALDRTGPELLQDLLETRLKRAILPQQETRCAMIVEAAMAIQSGDPPEIIRHKMGTIYLAQAQQTSKDNQSAAPTIDVWAQRLRRDPVAQMDFDQIADLLTDLGTLAHSDGIDAFRPLPGALKGHRDTASDILRHGLDMMLAGTEPDQVMDILETQGQLRVEELDKVYRLVIEGVLAMQRGDNPEWAAAKMRAELQTELEKVHQMITEGMLGAQQGKSREEITEEVRQMAGYRL